MFLQYDFPSHQWSYYKIILICFWERVFKYELSKSISELSIPKGIRFYIDEGEIEISKWVMSSKDISRAEGSLRNYLKPKEELCF